MATHITSDTRWTDLLSNACILEYEDDVQAVRAAVDFVRVAQGVDGQSEVCMRVYPETPIVLAPLPVTVHLIAIADHVTYTFELKTVAFDGVHLTVCDEPLRVTHRFLRQTPRKNYLLGPCAAVVHTAEGAWRGVIEFWVRDVSENGVGFKVEMGNTYNLGIGDSLRAPLTLPDGRRGWVDGQVVWLNGEGRGGMATRQAPRWITGGDYADTYAR